MLLLLIGGLVSVDRPAAADLITFGFDGTVVSSQFSGAPPLAPPAIGTPVHLEYTFDSSTTPDFCIPDCSGNNGLEAQYTDTLVALTVSFGTNTVVAATLQDTTLVDLPANYEVLSDGAYSLNGAPPTFCGPVECIFDLALFLWNGSGSPTSGALPLVPPDPLDFPTHDLFVALFFPEDGGSDLMFRTDIESSFLVPEPATGLLLALTLGGAVATSARGRRS